MVEIYGCLAYDKRDWLAAIHVVFELFDQAVHLGLCFGFKRSAIELAAALWSSILSKFLTCFTYDHLGGGHHVVTYPLLYLEVLQQVELGLEIVGPE